MYLKAVYATSPVGDAVRFDFCEEGLVIDSDRPRRREIRAVMSAAGPIRRRSDRSSLTDCAETQIIFLGRTGLVRSGFQNWFGLVFISGPAVSGECALSTVCLRPKLAHEAALLIVLFLIASLILGLPTNSRRPPEAWRSECYSDPGPAEIHQS